MKITTERELVSTQKKLRLLEEQYHDAQSDPGETAEVREVTLFSLKQLMNQIKEQIAIYHAHADARR